MPAAFHAKGSSIALCDFCEASSGKKALFEYDTSMWFNQSELTYDLNFNLKTRLRMHFVFENNVFLKFQSSS